MPLPFFWITNISKMDVHIADLGLTIKSRRSINLLNSRHCDYTPEQLETSWQSGDLKRKSDKVVRRQVAPSPEAPRAQEIDSNAVVPTRRRSMHVMEEIRYEELEISDEQFATDAADLVDHK